MPATDRRTRLQIRQAIGIALGAVDMDAGAITHTPSETAPSAGKIIDNALAFGAENEHRGKWVLATDAASSVYVRRIIGSSPDERSITLSVPFDSAPSTAWTYELWDQDVSPIMVHQFINDALSEVTRKGSVAVTQDSFHTGADIRAWDLSSALLGVRDVWWRRSYTGEQLFSFDEAATSAITQVGVRLDSVDAREGAAANIVSVAAGASAGFALINSSFSAVDMRGYTHLEFWVQSNVTLNSSNLQGLLLEGSTARELFNLPALNADSWTRVKISLATTTTPTENDSAITTFRLRTGSSWADTNTAQISIDDLIAYREGAEDWATVPRDFWTVDKDRRRLVLKSDASVPYAKLQVFGVRAPNLLSVDSAVSEIDAQYVVNSVIAKVLRANADRRGNDADAAAKRAVGYEQLAQAQRIRWSMPSGVRWIDD